MPQQRLLISPATCSTRQSPRPWPGSGSFCRTSPSRIRVGLAGLCLSTALTAAAFEVSRRQAITSSSCSCSSFRSRFASAPASGAALNCIGTTPLSAGGFGDTASRANASLISVMCLRSPFLSFSSRQYSSFSRRGMSKACLGADAYAERLDLDLVRVATR